MNVYHQVLWMLDHETSPSDFERLSVDLLGREGYHHIVPIGGTQDQGRDAECRFWRGVSDRSSVVAFQFSLQKKWESKLRKDIKTIAASSPDVAELVFVSSQKITGKKQDALRKQLRSQRGWKLTIYPREWLRHRLTEFHPDLTKKYLGIDLPPTVGFWVMSVDFSDSDEEWSTEEFPQLSRETIQAAILESTRKEPAELGNWHRLAKINFAMRNYDAALKAIDEALRFADIEPVLRLDMINLQGAVLAELGMQTNSRPLLVRAKHIFQDAVVKLKRAVDHYNLANVLCALVETDKASVHYLRCLELEPDYAKAWKNYGSLLVHEGDVEGGVGCFDKALSHQPRLIEAHLSKATVLLLFCGKVDDAIRCFETAYGLIPELDNERQHVRYWFSQALLAAGREEDALEQIERGMQLYPDDVYLLNQKAVVLSRLARKSPAYEDKAIQFLSFRASAMPEDFFGLFELIGIFERRGCPETVWPLIEENLPCGPFPLGEIAARANISVSDFRIGFRHARLFHLYRQKCAIEDQYIELHQHGLCSNKAAMAAIHYATMAPFGVLAQRIAAAQKEAFRADVNVYFMDVFQRISDLFIAFGPHWLSEEKPKSRDEQIRLLSIGMMYITDIIVSESARIIGFIAGYHRVPEEMIPKSNKQGWSGFITDNSAKLLERVAVSWEMVKP